jgi:hypothetical protein
MAMNSRQPLYNPSFLDRDVLQATLARDESLLVAIIKRHQHDNAFSLLSGPSGSGKSHLLTLLFHQMKDHPSFDHSAQLIRLPHSPLEIVSYLDLLLHLLALLTPHPQIDTLYTLPQQDAIVEAEQILKQASAAQRLLLLCENFDVILTALGHNELKQFKALLADNPTISMIATTTKPTVCLSVKDNPLAELFEHFVLTPLTVDQACQLLVRLAKFENNPKLAAIYDSPTGCVCVSALHHLAVGIPRHYVAFAQQVKQDPLAEFGNIMMRLLDDLSPAWQATLQQLPTQQLKLLHAISRQSGAETVGQIAAQNRLTHQTTSGQLKKLKDAGYVVATVVGRGSYYEMAKPLMRLVLALNHPQTSPVRSCVDFLLHWHMTFQSVHLAQGGQYFVFDKPWLYNMYLPKSLPLVIRLQHTIDSYIEQLSQGNNGQFDAVLEKLREFSKPFYGHKNQSGQLDHITLLHGLTAHNLANNCPHNALIMARDLFEFALEIDCDFAWKHLGHLSVGLTALFAINECIEHTQPFINHLEKLEARLHSLAFSIDLSHCLVNKAKGFALTGDKLKTQQALEQLRIRAEKRNSPEISGAFSHAVKATMSFIATNDERLAVKVFKQVEDICGKYQHTGLAFACANRLWAVLPDALPFDTLIDSISQIKTLDCFNHEVYRILQVLSQRPFEIQITGYASFWQKMVSLDCPDVFASGLIQVSLKIARQTPLQYDQWLSGCLSLLNNDTCLSHCGKILLAVQRYLQAGNDDHQLLVLPLEERSLVRTALSQKPVPTFTG